jgi:hypothetical protein
MLIFGGQDLREGLVPGLWMCTINEEVPEEEVWEEWEVNSNGPPALTRHTAVLYQDRMYLFGGTDNTLENQTVYVLDLTSQQWTSKGPEAAQLPPAIDSHSAVVYSGKMIVFGGFIGGSRSNRAFCLDLPTLRWREIEAAGELPIPRASHSAVVNADGMYVFGGNGEDGTKFADMWKMDLLTWEWVRISPKGDLPEGRSGHSACSYANSMVIFGGVRELTKETNEMWAFSFSTMEWTLLQEERKIEDPVSAAQLEEYKRGKPSKSHSPQTAPVTKHSGSPISPNPRLHELKPLPHFHLYEGPPSPLVGRIIGRAPYPRDGHSAVVINDKMLVFGGDRYQMPFNDLYAYALNENTLRHTSRGK